MGEPFRARVGQVVLVEVGEDALTGVVIDAASDGVVLDLTSTPAPAEGTEVLASVFAPEALYRARATAHVEDGGCVRLEDVRDVETIQRRRWPRRRLTMPVSLMAVDGPEPAAVTGETIDIGVGGAHLRAGAALPHGADPVLTLSLPDGSVLLLAARVVSAHAAGTGYEYRVAFQDLEADDAARLAELVSAVPA